VPDSGGIVVVSDHLGDAMGRPWGVTMPDGPGRAVEFHVRARGRGAAVAAATTHAKLRGLAAGAVAAAAAVPLPPPPAVPLPPARAAQLEESRLTALAHAARLATASAVAASTGVTRAAVSTWLSDCPDFSEEALVARVGRVVVVWLPAALAWAARRGLPVAAPLLVPGPGPEALEAVRAAAPHLITPGGIARRAGVRQASVSNWLQRRPGLDGAIIADLGGTRILWWPAVREWLAGNGTWFADDTPADIIEDPSSLLDVIPSWQWTDEETASALEDDDG